MTEQVKSKAELNALKSEDAVIVLFGATGAGKSSFANTASGKPTELVVGDTMESCTQDVGQTYPFIVDGKPVVIVDCPGFDDSTVSDADILKRIAAYLAATYESKMKITGLLYLHRISDNRLGGTGHRNFRMFRKMCGSETLKNVVIVTNMWSEPPKQIEIDREAELQTGEKYFKGILAEGAQIVRHSHRTRDSALDIIRLVLGKDPVVPVVAQQIIDDKISLVDTDAGQTLGEDITNAIRKTEEQMQKDKEDYAQAIKDNDRKAQDELDKEKKKNEATIQKFKDDEAAMKKGIEAELAKAKADLEEKKRNRPGAISQLFGLLEEGAEAVREMAAKFGV